MPKVPGTDLTRPKCWLLVSHCASAKPSRRLAALLGDPAPRLSSAPARRLSPRCCCCRRGWGSFLWQDRVVCKRNGLSGPRAPGCTTPSRPAPTHSTFPSLCGGNTRFPSPSSSCAQPQQVSPWVTEPIFPWRAGEGGWRGAQEQDGLAFEGDHKERCVLLQAEQRVAPGQARAVEVPQAPPGLSSAWGVAPRHRS